MPPTESDGVLDTEIEALSCVTCKQRFLKPFLFPTPSPSIYLSIYLYYIYRYITSHATTPKPSV